MTISGLIVESERKVYLWCCIYWKVLIHIFPESSFCTFLWRFLYKIPKIKRRVLLKNLFCFPQNMHLFTDLSRVVNVYHNILKCCLKVEQRLIILCYIRDNLIHFTSVYHCKYLFKSFIIQRTLYLTPCLVVQSIKCTS